LPLRPSYPGGIMSYSSTYGFPIQNARDGIVSPGDFFGTVGVGGDWWQLDLGTPVPIGELAIWFRYNCCNQRSANVVVTIEDGASNILWMTATGPGYVPNGPWLNNTNFVVSPEVMGQIVRIEHPVGDSDPLELSEVAVLGPSSGLCIVADPVGQTVVAGDPAALFVGVSGTNAPITYQWKHAGTNLPGATDATILISSVGPANTGDYSVVVSDASGRQRTSSSATLSTFSDSVPPTVVGHAFDFNRFSDVLRLTVNFSEPLREGTATNPANYVFVSGATVTNAVLDSTGSNVTLNVSGLASCADYTINVSGVQDLAGNLIVPTRLSGILPAIQHSYPGGTATMSSIYDNTYNATKARDGNLNTFANSSQSETIQEWWELDLGSPVPIGELGVWFRADCCTDRNADMVFTIMDAARTPLWTNAFDGSVFPLGVPTNCVVAPPVMGQFVRIEHGLGDLGTISLGEVLVLETPPSPCVGPAPTVTIALSGSQLNFTWPGSGWILQTNATLGDPVSWGDVPGATNSPATASVGPGSMFYRLRQQ
jgi:hypothetical protein